MEDLNLEASDTSNGYHGGADERTSMMYEQIVSSIVEHRIAPGTRFREEQLAQLFEVSRTQVRKVLQRLEHERLVERRPRRGVTVACPDQEETREIFEARNLIEPWIVGQLCKRCAPEDWVGIRRIVQQEHQAHQKGDRHAAVRLSGEFHRALAAAAGNRSLNKTMEELTLRTCLAILANQASTQITCRDDEHQKIMEAIDNNDPRTATRLMISHLHNIERSLEPSSRLESTDALDVVLKGLPVSVRSYAQGEST
jgi:DNA-binding GntR family transcriptional regulator